MARRKRPTDTYLESARDLAQFVPSLKRYKRRKTLKPWEKGHIARYENIIRYTDHLIPVTPKKARELKEMLFEPQTMVKSGKNKGRIVTHHGIMAVQLRNTGTHAKIARVNDIVKVVSNGRTWALWQIENTKPRTVKAAGTEAFTTPEAYDIERVIELARKAFDNPVTKGVFLWAESGRVGEGFKTLGEFVQWVGSEYTKYRNTDRWVKGIQILVADADEYITPEEWASFGTTPERRYDRKKRRRARRKQQRR